jgi:hypothetical protein
MEENVTHNEMMEAGAIAHSNESSSVGANLDYDEYLFDHKEQLFKEFLEQEDEEMTFEDYCVKRHQEKAFLCKARWCHFELDDMYNTDEKYCHYCDTNMGDRLKELNERYINEEK